mgnify:CR=1 FL=1
MVRVAWRMQRTLESFRANPRTTSQVPSGELSSTKTTSQAMPVSVASSRRYSTVTLSRSLKVGTTTESSGKAACDGVSGPGWMASFMIASVYPQPLDMPRRAWGRGGRTAKTGMKSIRDLPAGPIGLLPPGRVLGPLRLKMLQKCQRPRTEGRAYIRRSQAIHGRPGAGALKRQRRR